MKDEGTLKQTLLKGQGGMVPLGAEDPKARKKRKVAEYIRRMQDMTERAKMACSAKSQSVLTLSSKSWDLTVDLRTCRPVSEQVVVTSCGEEISHQMPVARHQHTFSFFDRTAVNDEAPVELPVVQAMFHEEALKKESSMREQVVVPKLTFTFAIEQQAVPVNVRYTEDEMDFEEDERISIDDFITDEIAVGPGGASNSHLSRQQSGNDVILSARTDYAQELDDHEDDVLAALHADQAYREKIAQILGDNRDLSPSKQTMNPYQTRKLITKLKEIEKDQDEEEEMTWEDILANRPQYPRTGRSFTEKRPENHLEVSAIKERFGLRSKPPEHPKSPLPPVAKSFERQPEPELEKGHTRKLSRTASNLEEQKKPPQPFARRNTLKPPTRLPKAPPREERQQTAGILYPSPEAKLKRRQETRIPQVHSTSPLSSRRASLYDPRYKSDLDLLGMTPQEFEAKCEEYFSSCANTYKFVPKKFNRVDLQIDSRIRAHAIRIPIAHLEGTTYLVGTKTVNCELSGANVLVRVGGGFQTLEDYVRINKQTIERSLMLTMLKSSWSMQQVVNSMIAQFGQKKNSAASSEKGAVAAVPGTSGPASSEKQRPLEQQKSVVPSVSKFEPGGPRLARSKTTNHL